MNTLIFPENLPSPLKEKAFLLQKILHNFAPPFVIACSGGLDSRFLAFFAKKTGCRFSLLHAAGKHVGAKETEYLKEWSKRENIPLTIIPVDILKIEHVRNNHPARCYHCKLHTFGILKQQSGPSAVCDGTHAEDKNTYRPGLAALQELSIQSPLALANFSKQDIRELAKAIGLENHMQKARPCFLTRFPYHVPIQEIMLNRLIELEDFFEKELTKICGDPSPDFRVRHIQDTFCFHYDQAMRDNDLIALQTALNKAKIPDIKFERLSKLSGYFDK